VSIQGVKQLLVLVGLLVCRVVPHIRNGLAHLFVHNVGRRNAERQWLGPLALAWPASLLAVIVAPRHWPR
jgi:hypothetical protein